MAQDMKINSNYRMNLKSAIENNWLIPYFQPLMNTQTRECNGAEILARLSLPGMGIYSPSVFITDTATKEDLIQLTRRMMELSCTLLIGKNLPNNFMLSFKITADTLVQPWLISSCKSLIAEGAGTLVLELDELESVRANYDLFNDALATLRQSGIRIGLTDSDSSNPKVSLLLQPGSDFIRIPKEYVTGCEKLTFNRKIIDNIVYLAGNMNIKTIAEGVCNYEQEIFLTLLGVEVLQGSYYSEPLDGDAFMSFIEMSSNNNNFFSFISRMMSPVVLQQCSQLHNLTPREAEMVSHIARSVSVKSDARSSKTRSSQKRSAYRKIGVTNDIELIHYLYNLRDK
ncbi:EAL domain-containing protein [Citrobacter freundii]